MKRVIVNTRSKAYRVGYSDGYEMACESGSADPGSEGWDGLAINAVGFSAFASSVGCPVTAGPRFVKACRAYVAGANSGAQKAVKEAEGG